MRIVVYEKARKRSRVGNSPSACWTTPAGRQDNRRSDGNCRGFQVFGKTLEASPEKRRHGGVKSQTASGAQAPIERCSKTEVAEIPRSGTAKGWLPQRSLDLYASRGSRCQAISGSLPSMPRLEDSPRPWLDQSETRAAGERGERRRHRTLAQAGLAANKKGARETLTHLVFLDESGFMLQPVSRRTWAPSGQTPVQKAWDRHERLSAISIICVSPLEHRL